MIFRLLSIVSVLIVTASFFTVRAQDQPQRKNVGALKQEESLDYYQKWLNEDVLYLISDDERAVFEKLTTTDEKDQFVEQFWHRRDPDIKTPTNEFKEEHYRRIAYANEWFTSGTPGWKTDRGRIYITHGPPDDRERHPAGGPYLRPAEEGGGGTATYPFEKWWYRNMAGLGAVVLEFVDPSSTGEYRLALDPFEKDALKFVPGAGLTEAEMAGESFKADRPYYYPGNYAKRSMYYSGYENDPFRQWEKFVVSQKPAPIKYPDLKQIVDVNISYTNLPFKVRADCFKLNDEQVLVPVTVELSNRELTFKEEGGRHVARVAFYGAVTSIGNRLATEFDDDMTSAFPPEKLQEARNTGSVYQKILSLDAKTRYKLDLVVKDLNSGKVGVLSQAIVPPKLDDSLFASSLLLADVIFPLEDISQAGQMFVLGDVKVRPNVRKTFIRNNPVGLYLQVYNIALDQATGSPLLRISYTLLREGNIVIEAIDEKGASVQYGSDRRTVLIRGVPTKELEPGPYQIRVKVEDLIAARAVVAEDQFQIVAPASVAQR